MSISSLQSNVTRIMDDISKINKDLSQEYRKESDKASEMYRIRGSINKNTSTSILSSKQRQIESCERSITESKKKQSELTKKMSDKQYLLGKEQDKLAKEQTAEQKKFMVMQDKALRQQKEMITDLQRRTLSSQSEHATPVTAIKKEYDFFISYASEDRAEIAEPLALALQDCGAKVWYDRFALTVGDSLRNSIDIGLASSRYGIVILTPIYFTKFWTEKELNGLFAKWAGGDDKLILPVWHNISKDVVTNYSPMLADIVALKTADFMITELANEFYKLIT